jgi:hypothetical protein
MTDDDGDSVQEEDDTPTGETTLDTVPGTYFTSPNAPINDNECFNVSMTLANKAFMHRMLPDFPDFDDEPRTAAQQFALDRYSRASFQGILRDTEAAKNSTCGHEQFLAL